MRLTWLHRKGRAGGDGLLQAIRALDLPPGDCHFWAAGESLEMRRLRPLFVDRGAPKEWIKAAGYWKRGAVGTHESIED